MLTGQSDSTKSYFESYTDNLTTRIYEVTKFNSIQFISSDLESKLTYRPNTNLNVGFGFNYRGFGLNLGFNLPYINNDDDLYGSTKHFNADANTYTKTMNLTAFFEYYSGYYLSESNGTIPPLRGDSSLAIREDLEFFSIGLSGTYVFNHGKVSYRAAFTQDAWQKKSAGSPLLGAFAVYANVRSDSSLVIPYVIFDNIYDNAVELKAFEIGPMVGYMYSLVLKEHWFVTISGSAGIGLNYSYFRLPDVFKENAFTSFNPAYRLQARFAFGYNSRRNYAGISYVNENSRTLLESGRTGYNIGNIRLNLIHRFDVKSLGFIDDIMDTFSWIFLPRTDAKSE